MENLKIVSAVISMSLDGFIAGECVSCDKPLGDGGEQLHEWVEDGSLETDKVLSEGAANLGAVICGRLTYDLSIPWWQANGPTGEARIPVFVISYNQPDTILQDGVYTFVKDIDTALVMAKSAAGNKGISIMGGAKTIQKFINKGYVDEIHIQLVPVLLGKGKRLFDNITMPVNLKTFRVISSKNAIHLGFSVEYPPNLIWVSKPHEPESVL